MEQEIQQNEQRDVLCGNPLERAAGDYWRFGIRLLTGEIIYFSSVTVNGDWVYLHNYEPASGTVIPMGERPLAVRISAIVWFWDAPS